jgi:hypothetical protein
VITNTETLHLGGWRRLGCYQDAELLVGVGVGAGRGGGAHCWKVCGEQRKLWVGLEDRHHVTTRARKERGIRTTLSLY